MWNKLSLWAAPLKFGFLTDLRCENSGGFYTQSLLTFFTMVTHWWHSSSNLYTLIGQNLTGEFMRNMYAASETCFLIVEANRVVCRQLVMFLTVFFHWICKMNTAAIKILMQLMAGLFIGFMIEKCATCQNHGKSNFVWHCFHFSPCLMHKRVKKAQVILALLDGLQELHLDW